MKTLTRDFNPTIEDIKKIYDAEFIDQEVKMIFKDNELIVKRNLILTQRKTTKTNYLHMYHNQDDGKGRIKEYHTKELKNGNFRTELKNITYYKN